MSFTLRGEINDDARQNGSGFTTSLAASSTTRQISSQAVAIGGFAAEQRRKQTAFAPHPVVSACEGARL